MKIIITGSLGHISKPLTEELVKKGHTVTVISSNTERQKDIEAMGATAAIGTVADPEFLAETFTGADAVYTIVPPGNYFNTDLDVIASWKSIGNNYARAIRQSGVKRVVHLSSIGAHLEKGSGLILGHHAVENIFNELSDVNITFMRPVGFYYNLYSFLPMIKKTGFMAAVHGADDMLVWVSPTDIAAAIAEELESPAVARRVLYVASDELTGNETARILGDAIGIPGLKWNLITGEQMQHGLEAAGMNPGIAAGMVEMYVCQHNGILNEDYYRHQPVLGKVKLTDFAKEFAVAFHQK